MFEITSTMSLCSVTIGRDGAVNESKNNWCDGVRGVIGETPSRARFKSSMFSLCVLGIPRGYTIVSPKLRPGLSDITVEDLRLICDAVDEVY